MAVVSCVDGYIHVYLHMKQSMLRFPLFGDPVVPSQKVRLDPPGTYIAASSITVPEKVRLDPDT